MTKASVRGALKKTTEFLFRYQNNGYFGIGDAEVEERRKIGAAVSHCTLMSLVFYYYYYFRGLSFL